MRGNLREHASRAPTPELGGRPLLEQQLRSPNSGSSSIGGVRSDRKDSEYARRPTSLAVFDRTVVPAPSYPTLRHRRAALEDPSQSSRPRAPNFRRSPSSQRIGTFALLPLARPESLALASLRSPGPKTSDPCPTPARSPSWLARCRRPAPALLAPAVRLSRGTRVRGSRAVGGASGDGYGATPRPWRRNPRVSRRQCSHGSAAWSGKPSRPRTKTLAAMPPQGRSACHRAARRRRGHHRRSEGRLAVICRLRATILYWVTFDYRIGWGPSEAPLAGRPGP